MSEDDEDEKTVVSIKDGKRAERSYEVTLISNSRRYTAAACRHKGPYTVDVALATVECGDCGALLNPLFVLEMLANREAYWNQRRKDLSKHLVELNAEIEARTRTRCTHCSNMTAIRFKSKMPLTWVPQPYR